MSETVFCEVTEDQAPACEHNECKRCCLVCARAELKQIAAKYLGRA